MSARVRRALKAYRRLLDMMSLPIEKRTDAIIHRAIAEHMASRRDFNERDWQEYEREFGIVVHADGTVTETERAPLRVIRGGKS
jgi:hypothetical protein